MRPGESLKSAASRLVRNGKSGEVERDAIDDSRSWAEPLAPSTIARKGHDHPLVETGHMRNAVSYAERRNGVIVTQGGEKT